MYDIMNAILKNMINQGSVLKGDSMASIISTRKDYVIELERKDISNYNLISGTSGNLYICILRFKDNMGRVILELHLNEIQALRMIDGINEYFSNSYSLTDMVLLSDILTIESGITDSICITYAGFDERINEFIYVLEVKEYNKNNEMVINRLRIEMDQDKLEALCNVMYFIYLIDIDETIDFSDNFVVANLQNIDIELLEDIKGEQYNNE